MAISAAYMLVLHAIVVTFFSALTITPAAAAFGQIICTPNGAATDIGSTSDRSLHADHGSECCVPACTPLQPALPSGAAIATINTAPDEARPISADHGEGLTGSIGFPVVPRAPPFASC